MENLYKETQFNEVLGITNGIFSLRVIWKELDITKPCYNEHFSSRLTLRDISRFLCETITWQ